ncbi:MAG TPA: ATP-binding domain-containing protein [Actinomycetota bacterium]|nr:ATP-binding domain-containing protein [Actinomycetota bacterium]
MTLDTVHPELEREQAYVDHAYACMDRMRAEASGLTPVGRNDFEQEAFDRWQRARVAALSDTTSALVFGRIDRVEDEAFYVGRHHVRDEGFETVVVDWRAPVSRAFYQAHRTDPMGLRRRRHFLVDGREVLGIADDDLTAGTDHLRAEDVLAHELGRARTGTMRDIVATIQAEQDEIIRAPLAGAVVVQGGPGTGKTAIGLHRAAFLLYEHRRRLERLGVLVLGPNPVFVRYVEQVLPSLGEAAVMQLAVADLSPWVRVRAGDDPRTERLKGDQRMAVVLRRALQARRRDPEGDLEMRFEGHRFTLTAEAVREHVSTLIARGAIYRDARERLRDALVVDGYRAYAEAVDEGVTAPFEEVSSAIRRDPSFRRLVDRVWPAASPEPLVDGLLTSPSRLSAAAAGVLSDEEMGLLRRPKARKGEPVRWTRADRPLLDEARALIEGPPDRYGHVVVDEAQDLSPMQLRMVARRCPHGSATILGDLGQASGVWAHDDWTEVVEHLETPDGSHVTELTLGYRVSPAIMEVASAVLARTAPGLRAPRSVRREPGRVTFTPASPDAVGAEVAQVAADLAGDDGSVAVIAPQPVYEQVREGLITAGLSFGEADRQGLEQTITLVPVRRCKGLEFDAVVCVEPRLVVEEDGPRMLYVALTRAMRSLAVVWSGDLPDVMSGARPASP